MRRALRIAAAWLAAALGIAVAAAALLLATAVCALRAGPGEWSVRAAVGPFGTALSVPALIRVATHPLGVRVLAGRSVSTRFGVLHADAGTTPGGLVLRCAPCVIDSRLLAAAPVRIASVEASVEHGEPNQWRGVLRAGAVRATWKARLAGGGADVEIELPDTPVAAVVALFGPAVPEGSRARIGGRAGATVRVALPSRRHAIVPRLVGLTVDGLGTEALIAASPAPACARPLRPTRASAPFGPWLPKAVVAAEDQRFFEHAGYDVAEMAAAWSSDAAGGEGSASRRGASTLSQQLAKLLYTGDERTAARKVRELLYAVELDRTLGKARVLQLYLAIAPWGDGQCGAQAAALHAFGRPASRLEPAEAVWLASLLRNPDAALRRAAETGADTARLQAIAAGMRPTSRAMREVLELELGAWQPPPMVQRRGAVLPADRVASGAAGVAHDRNDRPLTVRSPGQLQGTLRCLTTPCSRGSAASA